MNNIYRLTSDYCELAHPKILSALSAASSSQFAGYGLDGHCSRAGDMIRNLIHLPSADVHFACGGTQANLLVISAALRPFEAVIAAESGHIAVHEAGSIEATGHKICTAPGTDGKLLKNDIISIVTSHTDEHMVKPRLVYISQSTETGLVYNKAELTEIYAACKELGLYLFIDGARLGAAVNSSACDLSYSGIAELCDVFTLGGTKNGALLGEAIVIINDRLKPDFRYCLKQRGALISKGAAIGIQFETLLTDGLYDTLARHANKAASMLSKAILDKGYSLLYPTETNMIFPCLPADVTVRLREYFDFLDWCHADDGFTAIRLVTSWSTPDDIIEKFITLL